MTDTPALIAQARAGMPELPEDRRGWIGHVDYDATDKLLDALATALEAEHAARVAAEARAERLEAAPPSPRRTTMADNDLIRRGDALKAVNSRANSDDSCHAPFLRHDIAALPAVTVGVPTDVKDYATDVSEAYDTMMAVERNPAGAWQVIQALAGHIAALEPVPQPTTDARLRAAVAQLDAGATLADFTKAMTDAAAVAMKAREAALREAAVVATNLKGNGWDDCPPAHPYDRGYLRACEIIAERILALLPEKPHDRA